MYRLLEKGVENKFQGDQISLAQVSALIKKSAIGEVIIPSDSDALYENDILSVYSITPPDLYWLVDARAEAIRDPVHCDTAPNLGTTGLTEYTCVVPFPTAAGSPPFFAGLTVSSSTTGVLYNLPSALAAGISTANSSYVIINNILEYFYRTQSPTRKVYWENYRGVYYANSFIFVGNISLGTVTIGSSSGVSSSASYTTYNRAVINNLASKEVKTQRVKPTQEDLLYPSLLQNQYYKTRYKEPIMDQLTPYFIVYRDESFLVSRLYYDYIRKPRTISLALNQSCELADTTHPKIVDLAIEILRLDTKDQSYPATVQDTQLRA